MPAPFCGVVATYPILGAVELVSAQQVIDDRRARRYVLASLRWQPRTTMSASEIMSGWDIISSAFGSLRVVTGIVVLNGGHINGRHGGQLRVVIEPPTDPSTLEAYTQGIAKDMFWALARQSKSTVTIDGPARPVAAVHYDEEPTYLNPQSPAHSWPRR